jgi:hypothetical protein
MRSIPLEVARLNRSWSKVECSRAAQSFRSFSAMDLDNDTASIATLVEIKEHEAVKHRAFAVVQQNPCSAWNLK